MIRPPPDIEPVDLDIRTRQIFKERRQAAKMRALDACAWIALGAVLGFIAGISAAQAEPVSGPIYVIDGDTARLRGGERVRVLNIDAPEISKPRCEAEAALGFRAKERLARLLSGARVTIHRCDGGRCEDQYGRTLARLEANGRDVGETLISEGLATRWPERFNGCGFRR